jgi:hypothetical protein
MSQHSEPLILTAPSDWAPRASLGDPRSFRHRLPIGRGSAHRHLHFRAMLLARLFESVPLRDWKAIAQPEPEYVLQQQMRWSSPPPCVSPASGYALVRSSSETPKSTSATSPATWRPRICPRRPASWHRKRPCRDATSMIAFPPSQPWRGWMSYPLKMTGGLR